MPWTWSVPLIVASSDSRCGIAMILVGVSSFFPPPIWKAENEHGWQVSHCASVAAIFIGWYVVSITPSWLPTSSANSDGREQHDERELTRSCGTIDLGRRVRQVPRRDREHDRDAGDQRSEQHVEVAPHEHRVGDHAPDVGELRLAVDHRVADRMLHPRVRGHDERRRQRRADRDHPDRRQVHAGRAACPSRTATARGTSTPGRTRRDPPSPAARRTRRRRSASRPTSSSRTGTPGRARSPRRSRC